MENLVQKRNVILEETMSRDLNDGETCEIQGSGSKPYVLKNTGGVYSCSCPAWRNQPVSIERRTCKHIRKLRGDAAEEARIGAPMAAPVKADSDKKKPPLLLATVWDGELDPTGWWMSEKLDGVRAFWNSNTRQFISRLGNEYLAPEWFTEGLPDEDLDGELWLGRKMFDDCSSIVRRHDGCPEWKQIRYLVFDAPAVSGFFEVRLCTAGEKIQKHPFARLHEHNVCKGIAHLKDQLAVADSLGAEGLMLRKPKSLYEGCRSSTLLKVKSFEEEEATVMGYKPGKGKYKGMMGALVVKSLIDNAEYEVGTGFSDQNRRTPPSVGTVVKIKYQELTKAGERRFSSYLGIRED